MRRVLEIGWYTAASAAVLFAGAGTAWGQTANPGTVTVLSGSSSSISLSNLTNVAVGTYTVTQPAHGTVVVNPVLGDPINNPDFFLNHVLTGWNLNEPQITVASNGLGEIAVNVFADCSGTCLGTTGILSQVVSVTSGASLSFDLSDDCSTSGGQNPDGTVVQILQSNGTAVPVYQNCGNDGGTFHTITFDLDPFAGQQVTLQFIGNSTSSTVDSDRFAVRKLSITEPVGATATDTAAADQSGADSFTYTVTVPGSGHTATGTITVTILPQAPQAGFFTDSTGKNQNRLDNVFNYSQIFSSTTASVVSNPTHGNLSNSDDTDFGAGLGADGDFTYAPDHNFTGTDHFSYQLRDGLGRTSIATVTIVVVPPPTAPSYSAGEIPAFSSAGGSGFLSNPDTALLEGGSATAKASVHTPPNSGSTLTLATNGSYTFVPNPSESGDDSFVYCWVDTFGQQACGTVSFNVIAAPQLVNQFASTNENTAVTFQALNGDHDPNGSALFIASVTTGGNAFGSAVIDASDPDQTTLIYTPDHDVNNLSIGGDATFSITVCDDNLGGTNCATSTVRVDITPVTQPPTASDGSISVQENSSSSAPANTIDLSTLSGDVDVAAQHDTLSWTVGGAGHGTVTVSGSLATYVPHTNFFGTDSFNYTIHDHGGVGGGNLSATATISVTVTQVAVPPIANDDSAITLENAPVDISPLTNDTDPNGNPLTIDPTGFPKSTAHGVVTLNGSHTVCTYTPAVDYNGPDSFTYFAHDSVQNVDSNAATVSITITPVLVLQAGSISTSENTPIELDLSTLVVTGNAPENFSVSQPAHGQAILFGSLVIYEPNANFFGADPFAFQVTDATGNTQSSEVSVTVGEIDLPPIANPVSVATEENFPTNIDVLSQATNPNGYPLTVVSVTQGALGSVTIQGNGLLLYVPGVNAHGTDTFTFTISDGIVGDPNSTSTVTVDIVHVLQPPTATPESYTVAVGGTLVVPGPGVLAGANDVDNSTMSAVLVAAPLHGTFSLQPNGGFTYAPVAGFFGTDVFTFQAQANSLLSNVSTATIVITPNPPLAANGAMTMAENSPGSSLDLSTLVTDTDTGTQLFSVSQALHGTVTHVGSVASYVPASGFSGSDSFTYSVEDEASGLGATGTVNVTVTRVNLAPIAKDIFDSTAEGTQVIINALAAAVDPNGNAMTVTVGAPAIVNTIGGSGAGTDSINPDQSVNYFPAPFFSGTVSIRYTVTDSVATNLSATATIHLSVTHVPHAPAQVTVVSPTSGSVVVAFDPVLTVGDIPDPDTVSSAVSIVFVVSTSANFSNAILTVTAPENTAGNMTAVTLTNVLSTNGTLIASSGPNQVQLRNDTFYWWRAQGLDNGSGLTGEWSLPQEFFYNPLNVAPGQPQIFTPVDGETVTVFQPGLVVDNASDPDLQALTYQFKVWDSANLDATITSSGQIAAGAFGQTAFAVPLALTEDHHYFWNVTAADPHGLTATSATAHFLVHTGNIPPTTPSLEGPAVGSTVVTLTPTLTIGNSSDPNHGVLSYYFELDVAPTFGSTHYLEAILVDGSNGVAGPLGTTTWLPGTLSEDTTYFWRVRAFDGFVFSDAAEGSFFVNTNNNPPTAPIALSPIGGQLVDSAVAVLMVENATDPDSPNDTISYKFDVYSNPELSAFVTSSGQITQGNGQTSFKPGGKVTGGNRYYWTCIATDSQGASSPPSPAAMFETVTVSTGCSTTGTSGATPGSAAGMLLLLAGIALIRVRKASAPSP